VIAKDTAVDFSFFCAVLALPMIQKRLHKLTLLSLPFNKERDVLALRKRGEVNPAWMLHFVQHDKSENVVPSIPFGHFKHFFFVIPSACEESIAIAHGTHG